jgi:hypothetical protein
MWTIDLGIPGVEITEEEDFVHLRLGDKHEVFSAYGATLESLQEAALRMASGRTLIRWLIDPLLRLFTRHRETSEERR